ncbi:hypothetical protein [Aeoliella mucimassa]|uniref:hypothetical protein n=1 Tax=Aeoliella mucimassa TaxID=2527972 RepID=UPI0011A1A387|nr:hypothetical protein [Aeoliella mucimassa]
MRWLLGAMLHACIGMTLLTLVTRGTWIDATWLVEQSISLLVEELPEGLMFGVAYFGLFFGPFVFFGCVIFILVLQLTTPANTKCLWYFLATTVTLLCFYFLPIEPDSTIEQETGCRLLLLLALTSLGSLAELWLRQRHRPSSETPPPREEAVWLASYLALLAAFAAWTALAGALIFAGC